MIYLTLLSCLDCGVNVGEEHKEDCYLDGVYTEDQELRFIEDMYEADLAEYRQASN